MIAQRYSLALVERLESELPFTELDKRLDENDDPKPEFQPNKQIDNIAVHHDICYRDAEKGYD